MYVLLFVWDAITCIDKWLNQSSSYIRMQANRAAVVTYKHQVLDVALDIQKNMASGGNTQAVAASGNQEVNHVHTFKLLLTIRHHTHFIITYI